MSLLNIFPFISRLLTQRGIALEDQERFLHPDFVHDLPDPLLMRGMEIAVNRIEQAIAAKETIGIFGDYDADGVPATALLVRCFRRLGVEAVPRIPTRASGYGLTAEVVEQIKEDGIQLLITVDNGTVAKAEIAALAAAGIPTIVCDHHQPHEGQRADAALAILNPKQEDCPYPFKELCGCGIAWKLMSALYVRLGAPVEQLKWELDLVGLSTIADMVPLLGENRTLAWYGLKVMHKSRNLGLRALAQVAGTDLDDISAGSIGFRLAPRINAPSRMHSEVLEGGENAALRLLTTEDAEEAKSLANFLNEQNGDRQDLLDGHLKDAGERVKEFLEDLCLVVYNEEWSSGVIGLLAGRLLEQHGRPVIVLASEGGQIKGSVRSVEGIDAVSLLAAGEHFLERFGGHAKAGGLTFKPGAEVAQFRQAVQEWMINQGLSLEQLAAASRKKPDMQLDLSAVTLEFAQEMELLEPFGIGFPAPLFEAQACIVAARPVGKTKQHLSCQLKGGGVTLKAIAFGLGDTKINDGGSYRVEFKVAVEEWQGARSAGCQIVRLEQA